MSSWLSFPGLGIKPFEVNPVAFTLFGKSVMWYGIIICIGMVLGFIYALKRADEYGISQDAFYDLVLFMVPIAIIGARIYFVLTRLEDYDSFYEMIAIWNGGLAIYGGIIAGFLTVLIFCKIRKVKFFRILDALAPGVMIGQLIGRWGNFTNAEAHGGITELPWRMGISATSEAASFCYHPAFLYESLWNLLGFLLIHFLISKKRTFDGKIFCFYIGWYGFGRTFIELLRTDSLYISLFGNDYKISCLVGIASVIAAAVLWFVLRSRPITDSTPAAQTTVAAEKQSNGSTLFASQAELGEETESEALEENGDEAEDGDESENGDEAEDGDESENGDEAEDGDTSDNDNVSQDEDNVPDETGKGE